MKTLDSYFLDLGLSWTTATFFSYVLFLLFGIFTWYILRNKKLKINWLNHVKNGLIISLPLIIYFAINPIYEGDVYSLGKKINSSLKFNEAKTLSIFVLPDCPYCLETLPMAQKLIQRNPSIKIEYIIASNPGEIPHGIATKIPKNFSFYLEYNLEELTKTTQGSYPSYCISENGKIIHFWSSSLFGTNALDEIEGFFEKK